MNRELVSIIIATKNEELNLETCLLSISTQSYKNIEIIVVDNNSDDKTKKIAKSFGALVINKGPERSTQRNYGIKFSSGKYIFFIDADMKLDKEVISDAVRQFTRDPLIGGVIVPEKSYGKGYWAKVKAYERSFYIGDDLIEAARFFRKDIILKLGGYDQDLIAGEDWDLSYRIRSRFKIVRIKSYIHHNEGSSALISILKKKYYYAKHIHLYFKKNKTNANMSVKFFFV